MAYISGLLKIFPVFPFFVPCLSMTLSFLSFSPLVVACSASGGLEWPPSWGVPVSSQGVVLIQESSGDSILMWEEACSLFIGSDTHSAQTRRPGDLPSPTS